MGQDIFDIHKFDEYKEDNRREVKAAEKADFPQTYGTPTRPWQILMAEL